MLSMCIAKAWCQQSQSLETQTWEPTYK